MKLVEFIKSNVDWEEKLQQKPYCLKIKKEGNLHIFNYNQIESDMSDPIVQESRGCILDIFVDTQDAVLINPTVLDVRVVCYPFKKFFNYSEGNAADIDWTTAKVTEKCDGSIIKLWNGPNGWTVSTNGVIDAYKSDLPPNLDGMDSFGKLFSQTLKDYDDGRLFFSPHFTYIFELCSPYNRVVVPHKTSKIYLIGMRNNETEEEVNVWENMDILPSIPRPKVYNLSSLSEILATAKDLPYDDEGYVVVDSRFNRVKIKSVAYLAAHRLKSAEGGIPHPKDILDLVRAGEEGEVLSYFPEFKNAFDRIKDGWNYYKEGVDRSLRMAASMKLESTDKASFAKKVNEHIQPKFRKYAFAFYDGKDVDKILEKVKFDEVFEE